MCTEKDSATCKCSWTGDTDRKDVGETKNRGKVCMCGGSGFGWFIRGGERLTRTTR